MNSDMANVLQVVAMLVMSIVTKLVSAKPLLGSSVLMNARAVGVASQVAHLGVERERPFGAKIAGADDLLLEDVRFDQVADCVVTVVVVAEGDQLRALIHHLRPRRPEKPPEPFGAPNGP